MSFSKARLIRFNEEIPQVPSPGRYDPKVDSGVKGAVMPISKRFPGQSTTSSSLDNIEKASSASARLMFRTPQLLRKVKLTPKIQYLKEKNFDTSGSDILSDERPSVKSAQSKSVSKADYKRLENELNSLSDKYNQMLMEKESEVDFLKKEIEEIKIHETELKEILEEKSKLATDRHTEALKLKDNLDVMIEKIGVEREEHQRFINDLTLKLSELENKKYELETVLAEKQSVIVTINDKCSDLEHELKLLQEENLMLEQARSCILLGAEEKLQQLETNIHSKLTIFCESLDLKFQDEQMPFQTKMNHFVHEFNSKSKEIIEQVKLSQEKVKELERLIDKKVNEFTKNIKEADERCKYLFRELCKVEEQRDELVVSDLEKKLALKDIQEQSDSYQSALCECKNTCRKYQITVNTLNQTITALSDRLLESEQEVERLNTVEKGLELQKRCLEEKSQLLLSDIISLRENMDKMEEEIIQDVTALKEDLEAKADIFKKEAVKTERLLTRTINDKQCAINLLLRENEYFKQELERKEEFLEEMKNKEKQHEDKIKKLKSDQLKVEEELSEKLNAQKNLYKILTEKFESANSIISDLQSLKLKQETQIISLLKEVDGLKEFSVTLERVNKDQNKKIQSLEEAIERGKDIESKQQQYIDELISDLVLEKERCEAVEIEKNRVKSQLHDVENNVTEKSEENEKLLNSLELMRQTLEKCEEKISKLEDEKVTVQRQLADAENRMEVIINNNSEIQAELQRQITELKCQLSSAKEVIKVEIPKLEHDNINKAENILELNLSIDSLKEEIEHQKTKISCLEAEKISLFNVLEENKSKIIELERNIQDKNKTISDLNEEHIRKDTLCQDLLSQIDSMISEHMKENEHMKHIADLEMQLSEKEKEVDLLTQRIVDLEKTFQIDLVNVLKDQLDEMQTKYNATVEERDRLSREVGELKGHHNARQRIKKVVELQQYTTELKEENEMLKLENVKLRTRLENSRRQIENKENVVLPQREDKLKVIKPGSAKKQPKSPGVLKPSNC